MKECVLIRDWLEPACQDGANLEARAQMQVASSMGATAFQKGLGAMHSLSHPCGSILGTHHGTTNAVVMPYVLEFNADAIDDRLTALARYLDLPNPSPEAVILWVLETARKDRYPTHVVRARCFGSEHHSVFKDGNDRPIHFYQSDHDDTRIF